MSLISRKLLTPDEVLKIENPYAIVMLAGKPPAITTIPDISEMYFNKLNGMGTREENRELRINRELKRKERPIQKIKIWNIWEDTEDDVKIKLILLRIKSKGTKKNEKKFKSCWKSITWSNAFFESSNKPNCIWSFAR